MDAYDDEQIDKITRGFVALWRGVLLQQIQDAASNDKKAEARNRKHQAIAWFNLDNDDFVDVCLLAGFNPAHVLRKFRAARERGFQWRKPAGTGWRTQQRLGEQQKSENAVEEFS